MLDYFSQYKGKSKTSCPNPADWIDAFGDADDVFCVAITSGLSGSYNAACIAKQMYEADHEGARVHVIDSLSAGPELTLIAEKLEMLILQGMDYEEICDTIDAYKQNTGLLFMLESLNNFAANGRVSPAVAKIAGVLGASDGFVLLGLTQLLGVVELGHLDAAFGDVYQPCPLSTVTPRCMAFMAAAISSYLSEKMKNCTDCLPRSTT